MTSPAPQIKRLSVEDYFRLEGDSVEKHEYRDGEVLAMSGGTPGHSLIIANSNRAIGNRLQAKTCRVYDSNLRVRLARSVLYSYPDITIICSPIELDPQDKSQSTALNPRVVVEVLSPSTEAYDRGEKFDRYRMIPSFEEYVLVSAQLASVQTFLRQADGTWLLSPYAGLEAVATIRSLNITIPLAEIYAGVEFPPMVERAGRLEWMKEEPS